MKYKSYFLEEGKKMEKKKKYIIILLSAEFAYSSLSVSNTFKQYSLDLF